MASEESHDHRLDKELRFLGNALDELRAMPTEVRKEFGHALWRIQRGETPDNASPMELSKANEIMKLTERFDGNTYRCVYAAKFEKAIYVLHAFQKKSNTGIATPKKEIDLVQQRLAAAKVHYADAATAGQKGAKK